MIQRAIVLILAANPSLLIVLLLEVRTLFLLLFYYSKYLNFEIFPDKGEELFANVYINILTKRRIQQDKFALATFVFSTLGNILF